MTTAGIEIVKDGISDRLDQMLTRAKSFQGAAARIYPVYQQLQMNRFQTEGASEGLPWDQLNPTYAAYKIKRYGGGKKRDGGTWKSWPGGGRKLLIGTSTLAGAIIGPGQSGFEGTGQHRALFTSTSMQISVDQSGNNAEGKPFTYPQYVAQKRKFMQFSVASINLMKAQMSKYILGGQ